MGGLFIGVTVHLEVIFSEDGVINNFRFNFNFFRDFFLDFLGFFLQLLDFTLDGTKVTSATAFLSEFLLVDTRESGTRLSVLGVRFSGNTLGLDTVLDVLGSLGIVLLDLFFTVVTSISSFSVTSGVRVGTLSGILSGLGFSGSLSSLGGLNGSFVIGVVIKTSENVVGS